MERPRKRRIVKSAPEDEDRDALGPDALLRDLAAMCERAREEEEEGAHKTTDCRIVLGDSACFAHSAILIMRSEFFARAFLHDMREAREKVINLSHVRPSLPKAVVHALLRFIYTGRLPEMTHADAWGLLELVGGAAGDSDYFALSDGARLRDHVEQIILDTTEPEGIVDALSTASKLGVCASGLRQILIENMVYFIKRVAQEPTFAQRVLEVPHVMAEVLKAVASHTTVGEAPRRLIGRSTALTNFTLLLSSSAPGLDNTAESVTDEGMDRGAGTQDEFLPAITARFEHPVTLRRMRLGIGSMGQGWSTAELAGAQLSYRNDTGGWTVITQISPIATGEIYNYDFGPFTSREWRLEKEHLDFSDHLGISVWTFHASRSED